ncbi:MAG: hypothetical protein ABWJ42_00800 [Sulfolobales archaeon]
MLEKESEGSVFEDLEVMYEDEDLVVMRAPDDDKLSKMVLKKISETGRPLSWKELRASFSGLAGEDRLRKILIKLIETDRLVEMPDGTFGLPGMENNYIPRSDVKRVRPLVPRKFRERWGTSASRYRKLSMAREIKSEEK